MEPESDELRAQVAIAEAIRPQPPLVCPCCGALIIAGDTPLDLPAAQDGRPER